MRLPDPFTNPKGLGFVSYTLRSNNKTMSTDTNSGETISVQVAGHTWELTVNFPESLASDDDSNVTRSFIMTRKGKLSGFTIHLPDKQKPRKANLPFTNLSSITAGQQGSSIIINNWSAVLATSGNSTIGSDVATGFISSNDLFKLSTHAKVYKVVSSLYNTSNNTLTLEIFPNLAIVTNGTEKPVFNEIGFSVKLLEDIFSEETTINKLQPSFSINTKETF